MCPGVQMYPWHRPVQPRHDPSGSCQDGLPRNSQTPSQAPLASAVLAGSPMDRVFPHECVHSSSERLERYRFRCRMILCIPLTLTSHSRCFGLAPVPDLRRPALGGGLLCEMLRRGAGHLSQGASTGGSTVVPPTSVPISPPCHGISPSPRTLHTGS